MSCDSPCPKHPGALPGTTASFLQTLRGVGYHDDPFADEETWEWEKDKQRTGQLEAVQGHTVSAGMASQRLAGRHMALVSVLGGRRL